MSENDAKRYFKKINTTFSGLNKQDPFAQIFTNIFESGNTTLYQKERRERRIFDDSWMTSVEEAIPVIDKLTRNPREYLKKTQVVVPVERAKKVDKDMVRHLAANTQFIKEVMADGSVTPTKVLSSFSDADLGTYENRFIRSLVDNLYIFIEKRYDLIIKKMHTEYVNFLNIKSTMDWNGATIDYDITLKINQQMEEDEIDKKNQMLLDRITNLRTSITNYKLSKFMIDMKEYPPVKPPIMQTNVIAKNVDYRRCYDLWLMVEQVDRIGFDVEVFDRDVQFDDEYMSHIQNNLMLLYATVANNQIEEFQVAENVPFEYRKTKRPKVQKTNAKDLYIAPGNYQLENYQLSQFYLDQIRNANFSRLKTLTDAGITAHESVDIIFQQVSSIADAVYEDYIQSTFNVEDAKDLNERAKIQSQIVDMYRKVEGIKRDGIKTLTTNKAIALLNLRNTQDEIKKIRAEELAEQKRIEAEQQAAKDAQKKAEDLEMKKLQQKIAQAQKVLDDAKKKMKERTKKKKLAEAAKAKKEKEKKAKEKKGTTTKTSTSKPTTLKPKTSSKAITSDTKVAKTPAKKATTSKTGASKVATPKPAAQKTSASKAPETKTKASTTTKPKSTTTKTSTAKTSTAKSSAAKTSTPKKTSSKVETTKSTTPKMSAKKNPSTKTTEKPKTKASPTTTAKKSTPKT
ncbi:MAG: hypothetical protein KKE16_03235 [Firmicutes bacterium]|nr:hypothetical protein [Bacillota bacterium]